MLELKNISFEVDDELGQKGILKDVSLTIDAGKLTVITGPNGGGKSTLARIIAGVEKPTSGKIFYKGEDITDMSITDRAKKGIGFAFQQPVKFKGIRVVDLIRLAKGEKSLSSKDACTTVYAAHAGTIEIDTSQGWAGPQLVKVTAGAGSLTTWYAHMQNISVSRGQTVAAGEPIGQVGKEGNVSGCHLHFEVHLKNGSIYGPDNVDPSTWLAENASRPSHAV